MPPAPGEQAQAVATLTPTVLTPASWSATGDVVTCPGASRQLTFNGGSLVYCLWACASYTGVTAEAASVDHQELEIAVFKPDGPNGTIWVVDWEKVYGAGACL